MKIGYARVSTDEQNLSLQMDALTKVGCEKIFRDPIGGGKMKRVGLDEALTPFAKEMFWLSGVWTVLAALCSI
jgi:DNA invertase Pin-like site-specific DNA recombinase